MGFLDGICDFVSSAVSIISSSVGSLGDKLVNYSKSFLSVVEPYLGTITQIIRLISNLLGVKMKMNQLKKLEQKAMISDKNQMILIAIQIILII